MSSLHNGVCVSIVHDSTIDDQFTRRTFCYYPKKSRSQVCHDISDGALRLSRMFPGREIHVAKTFYGNANQLLDCLSIPFMHEFCHHGTFKAKSWNMIPPNVGMVICEVSLDTDNIYNNMKYYKCMISGFSDAVGRESFSSTLDEFWKNVSNNGCIIKWSTDGSINAIYNVNILNAYSNESKKFFEYISISIDVDDDISLDNKTAIVLFKKSRSINNYILSFSEYYPHWDNISTASLIFELLTISTPFFNMAYPNHAKQLLMFDSWAILHSSPLIFRIDKRMRLVGHATQTHKNCQNLHPECTSKLESLLKQIGDKIIYVEIQNSSGIDKVLYTSQNYSTTSDFKNFQKYIHDNKKKFLVAINCRLRLGLVISGEWLTKFYQQSYVKKGGPDLCDNVVLPLHIRSDIQMECAASKRALYYYGVNGKEMFVRARNNIGNRDIVIPSAAGQLLFSSPPRIADLFKIDNCIACNKIGSADYDGESVNKYNLGCNRYGRRAPTEAPKNYQKHNDDDMANKNWRGSHKKYTSELKIKNSHCMYRDVRYLKDCEKTPGDVKKEYTPPSISRIKELGDLVTIRSG